VAAAIEERFGPIRVPSAPGARRPGTAPGAPGGGRGPRGAALVTGYPAPLARRTIAALLDPGDRDAGDGAPIYVLAAAGHAEEAARFVAALPGGARARILEGEVTAMDLGLSSAEHRALSSELSWIHHLSGAAVVGADVEAGRRLIVGGTRTVLDLARDAKRLERVVHWSSVLVSGDRTGTFREPDLDLGQRHESWVARAQLEAEVVVRAAMRGLPITVLRPSHVIGAAGQVRAASDRGAPAASPPPGSADDGAGAPDAIAALVSAIARAELSPAAVRAAWSLPARLVGGARGVGRAGASAPLHVVPIDFVVAAGAWVIGAERAAGRTFHLVDPAPLPLREVAVRVAELLAAAAPTSTRARSRLGRALRVAQLARGPRELQALRSPPVRYSDTEAAAALAGSGITCPPLVDYLPDLVRAAVAAARAAPASPAPAARRDDLADEDAQDPLA
jgi:nucleoside-diphosphate-sugar epimerase